MTKNKDAIDPQFHYEMWEGPKPEFGNNRKSIYYVENHNGQCGYAEIATDFSIAVDILIEQCRNSGLGNWVAPVAHLSRQLIELKLKSLMQSINVLDKSFDTDLLGRHNLKEIWVACRGWLSASGYKIIQDTRLEITDHLISAFHEIDPSGDLFRFGISRNTAFGKQKSYDRVGINLEVFERELKATEGFLRHWEATVFRENMKIEEGWDKDPYFDPEKFPRKL